MALGGRKRRTVKLPVVSDAGQKIRPHTTHDLSLSLSPVIVWSSRTNRTVIHPSNPSSRHRCLQSISYSILLEFVDCYFEGEVKGLVWLMDDNGYVVVMWTGRKQWLVVLVVKLVLRISCVVVEIEESFF